MTAKVSFKEQPSRTVRETPPPTFLFLPSSIVKKQTKPKVPSLPKPQNKKPKPKPSPGSNNPSNQETSERVHPSPAAPPPSLVKRVIGPLGTAVNKVRDIFLNFLPHPCAIPDKPRGPGQRRCIFMHSQALPSFRLHIFTMPASTGGTGGEPLRRDLTCPPVHVHLRRLSPSDETTGSTRSA